jgi:hypothetical protein
MYLKELYHHHKFWFLITVLFIIGQLFINYKRGVVFSPLYHYGMFSEVINPQRNYTVTEIFVDEKLLRTKDFSPYQWDKIALPVNMFYTQQQWNSTIWQRDIHRLLRITDSSKYLNNITEASFKEWYKNYLQTILHQTISTIKIQFTNYEFDGKELKAVSKLSNL